MAPHSSHNPAEPQSSINLTELYRSTTCTRQALTSNRYNLQDNAQTAGPSHDFCALLTLLCEIYQSYAGELIHMQPFHQNSERIEDGGHTCIVSRKAITTPMPSNMKRGQTENLEENIIVKRTRQGVFESQSSAALRSFIAELRVRAHPPLRVHPNIVDLKGVAWDFEDDELEKPRPLLLEEFATERSLEHFWDAKNLTRMPFKAKADLCKDIAKGLSALHNCDIVHGDVKPGNILIFPQPGGRTPYIAKLTDFGHSVFAYENPHSLPAFTPQYCAPEAYPEANGITSLTFQDLKQTDVYSYGLVILSIVIGRSFYAEFGEGLESYKKDDSMLSRAIALVEKEDRENTDSDFDLVAVRLLFSYTLRLESSRRNLARCISSILRYSRMQQPFAISYRSSEEDYHFEILKPSNSTLLIGYQSLSRCSFLLKEKIVKELQKLASDEADSRKPAACWELCICYFAGFGVERNFTSSSKWLAEAATQGVTGAQAFFRRIHEAMGVDPNQALQEILSENRVPISPVAGKEHPARDIISDWLCSSAASGCSEILMDLKQHDPERYLRTREDYLTRLGTHDSIGEHDLILADELSEERVLVWTNSAVARDVAAAAASSNLSLLRTLIGQNCDAMNFQDERGDTAVILAARCGRYDALKFLLEQTRADAGICNNGQQSALHFLSNFADHEIRLLVPMLVQKNASLIDEALPIRPSGEGPHLTPRIRSCPILQAILDNNVVLLQCLLAAAHLVPGSSACRICEAGSRYRRILAIAVLLHRAEAIEILMNHLETESPGRGTDIKNIEVWYNQALLPLWSLAVRAPAIGGLELPEPFFRALSCGKSYIQTLKKTLGLIWKPTVGTIYYEYGLLQESVLVANLDAISFITEKMTQRAYLPSRWWWVTNEFSENPLLLSVRLGFRDVFKNLWSLDQNIFNVFLTQSCCIEQCRECREPLNYSSLGTLVAICFRMKGKLHYVNLAHIVLSLAAVAAHQDNYFVSFVLEHTNQSQMLKLTTEFDGRFAHQPTSFLAQAILARSFRAADIILQTYPQILNSQVVNIVLPYLRDDSTKNKNLIAESYLLKFDSEPIPKSLPLIEYILLIGSYNSCHYLFRILSDRRKTISSWLGSSVPHHPATAVMEAGTIRWGGLKLSKKEFHTMLVGLIKDDREDRYPLWEEVRAQVSLGHEKKWYYLCLALFYANNRAVKELLRCGWRVNGPRWAYLIPSLSLAKRLYVSQDEVLPSFGVAYRKQYGPRAGIRTPVYYSFEAIFQRLYKDRAANLKKNIDTLTENKAHFPAFFESAGFRLLFWTSYLIFYLLVLPLAVGYSIHPDFMTKGQTIGILYLYAIGAMLLPPLPLLFSTRVLWSRPNFKTVSWVAPYIVLPIMWLFNNIGYPIILSFPIYNDYTIFILVLWGQFLLFWVVFVVFR